MSSLIGGAGRLAAWLAGRLPRGRTQIELERAYADRNTSLEASSTGLCLFAGGRPRFRNSAFTRLLGLDTEGGLTWGSFIARLDTAVEIGEEFCFWTDLGRYLRVRFTPAGEGELLVSADDLTDQERERLTRDRFVAEVVAAQEQESRRIAELLHDDAVQQLTALALRLELEAQRTDDGKLTGFARDASRVTASLRRLLVDLHPAVLESQGLPAAIEAAAGALREVGVDVEVTPMGRRLPTELEQLSYRLIQEALSNVLRHADARRVEVSVSQTGDVLRCQIRDDGAGFDPDGLESAVAEGHLGLHLVRERVGFAGGRFFIESRPGAGTTLSFELPLAHRVAREPLQEAVS